MEPYRKFTLNGPDNPHIIPYFYGNVAQLAKENIPGFLVGSDGFLLRDGEELTSWSGKDWGSPEAVATGKKIFGDADDEEMKNFLQEVHKQA